MEKRRFSYGDLNDTSTNTRRASGPISDIPLHGSTRCLSRIVSGLQIFSPFLESAVLKMQFSSASCRQMHDREGVQGVARGVVVRFSIRPTTQVRTSPSVMAFCGISLGPRRVLRGNGEREWERRFIFYQSRIESPELATFRSACLENGRAARMMGRYVGADCPD